MLSHSGLLVGDGGFDLHFLSHEAKENKGSARSSPRRRCSSAPHLNGFESTSKQKRDTPKGVSLFWWGMVDSNHRRHSQQIYSLSPLATREIPHIHFCLNGAGRRDFRFLSIFLL